jgi:serine phosphatase RsbU (regulator of sigma subunit)
LDQPAIFMTRLNASLESLTLGDSFVTAFMGLADPVSGLLTYASAGHPPALLRDGQGNVHTLPALDLGLGMLPGMDFRQETAILESGGLLLLCSDGALEAQSPTGQEYGLERLRAYVAQARPEEPQALLSGAQEDLRRHVESVHLEDDLAFLAITRPQC